MIRFSSLLLLCLFLGGIGDLPRVQGQVDHKIEVRLDDEKDILHGKEEVRYVNRSNTELQCIYFHLWPEAYSTHNSALAQQKRENGDLSLFYADRSERGGMDSLDFHVDGEKVAFFRDDEHLDIGHIWLNEPLAPGDTAMIRTPFRVRIPDAKFSRMGADGNSYRITQWYPKPAVYDRNGWNTMPYLNLGEFYNAFGSYDVSITLPKNYTVDGTGKLINAPKEEERLERLAKETGEIEKFPKDTSTPPSSEEMKTLRFKADRVTDFAWFADKRYRVLEENITLPRSGKKVKARVLFTDHDGKYWRKAMEYLKDAIYYYSLWVGDYPHDRVSVVSSRTGVGGGMEYPTITVIGPVQSDLMLDRLIAHEVGHNWFQGILATNEREDPWMDEGLNSYYEDRYMRTKYQGLEPFEGMLPGAIRQWAGLEDEDPIQQHYIQYMLNASREKDQALSLPADEFTELNYGAMVYSKGALLFRYLEEYLGTQSFDRSIRDYYSEHRFTHPRPGDLRRSFEQNTDKDLSPFFDDFLNTTGKIDLKAKKVESEGGFRYGEQYTITVKNKGDIAAPFPISVIHEDTIVEEKWVEGFEGEKKIQLPYHTGKVKAFSIDGKKRIPEADRSNNRYSNERLFPKNGSTSLNFLLGPGSDEGNGLYYFPSLGWNAYDGLMTGIGFHNQQLFPDALDFAIAPMYGWKSGRISGIGSLGWNHWSDDSPLFDHVRLSLNARRFSHIERNGISGSYFRGEPRLKLQYAKGKARSPHRHVTRASAAFIRKDLETEGANGSSEDLYWLLEQGWERDDALLPMEATLRGIHHEEFTRLGAEGKAAFRYNDSFDELKIRLFGGKFLKSDHVNPTYNWRMDGRKGVNDFLFEHYFFGRSEREGFLSQQFVRNEGGFRVPTAHGASNDWIASLGIGVDIPLLDWPTFSLFFNQGWAPSPFENGVRHLYEGGVSMELWKDRISVHYPLLFSPEIEDELDINGIGPGQRIRFEIRLGEMDPLKALRKLEL